LQELGKWITPSPSCDGVSAAGCWAGLRAVKVKIRAIKTDLEDSILDPFRWPGWPQFYSYIQYKQLINNNLCTISVGFD
jgi:hypothetical protein